MGRHHLFRTAIAGIAAAAFAPAAPATAGTSITYILNWIAGGDHAPYYWALQEGKYQAAGVDLTIEQGKGSQLSAQRVGIGQNELGLSDMANVLIALGKGAEEVAVMNVYANSPQGFYWLKSSGIGGPADFAGRKIGNPPSDAARAMWPAFAQATGLDENAVSWVNVQPNAKLAALKSKSIDITTSFYNIHHIFQAELGADMGFLAWKDVGVNPYGNSIIVNREFLDKNRDAVAGFVKVTQQAFHDCVVTPEPCVQALVDANTGLKFDNELQNWKLVTELMSDEHSRTVALGHFEPARMKSDYDLVAKYLEIDQPYEVETAYTNEFLDTSIKMPK